MFENIDYLYFTDKIKKNLILIIIIFFFNIENYNVTDLDSLQNSSEIMFISQY